MANRTVKDASSIHGTNPQYLVEKIIRTRIYDSKYWKEECFALTAELLVDKAMNLRYLGGVYGGNIKPSPFLCLTLKMLQIQPEKDIVIEFIKQDEFKYVRALGCFYLRLVHSSLDCYKYLSPLLNDYRKLRLMDRSGIFHLLHMDSFIDTLLREDRFCDIIMPRIQKRWVHEANNELEPRVSLLEDDLDDLESESDEEEEEAALPPSPTLAPSAHHRSDRGRHTSPAVREKKRHSSRSPSPDSHKRRRERDGRGSRDTRRHRDSGRGERDRGDHYGGYPSEPYHDYHHGNQHDYHHGAMATSTDYHHRRPHHHSNGATVPGFGDYHHSASGRDHRGGAGEYHHHHHKEDHYHDDHHTTSRRRDKDHRRGEERREDKKRDPKRKEGRSRRDEGDNLQAEIDEANALRAQLGLPPLK
ncbi:Pre-mRNA-splicing factor 38 C-terminal [Trinorchestia longiramus]|nr:Pre-mRNA-splicing factor 38 C-terminal [Trinorchestia longiramus]